MALDFAPIANVIGSAFSLVGNSLGLATTKRNNETTLASLREQYNILGLQFDEQQQTLALQGELAEESSKNLMKLIVVVFALGIIGMVIFFVVRKQTK